MTDISVCEIPCRRNDSCNGRQRDCFCHQPVQPNARPRSLPVCTTSKFTCRATAIPIAIQYQQQLPLWLRFEQTKETCRVPLRHSSTARAQESALTPRLAV